MNKNLVIAGVVVLVLFIAGGGYMVLNKRQTTPTGAQNATTAKPEEKTLFTSIKDALSKSISLECMYKDDMGRETKSYIKNGAIRADMSSSKPEETGSMIVKDRKMYFWTAQGGFMAQLPEGTDPKQEISQEQSMMESLEKYKSNCKPSVVADALFMPPTNVKFQDYTQMMKAATAPSGSQMMPSGIPTE